MLLGTEWEEILSLPYGAGAPPGTASGLAGRRGRASPPLLPVGSGNPGLRPRPLACIPTLLSVHSWTKLDGPLSKDGMQRTLSGYITQTYLKLST